MMRRPGLLVLLLCTGCAGPRVSVIEAFPPAAVAAPWILRDEVWSGTFEEAAPALGDDAGTWRKFGPTRVWLAIYGHENEATRWLKVRTFAFESAADAGLAFEAFRPLDARPFQAGDAGCWTEFGVLFRWGRLVFDIFGDSATRSSQVQSTYLAALIAKRMPRGAPENPL